MKLSPLTKEQQALCVQWRPLALRYARLTSTKFGLEHHDEADGIAHEALVSAVRVWDPKRAAFPSCLRVWIRARAHVYRAHRSQPVARSVRRWEPVPMYRLNVPIDGTDGFEQEITWQDVLEDPNPERLDDTDARRVARAFEVEAIRALIGNYTTARKANSARLTFALWARKFSDDEVTFEELGAEYGFSRQAAEQRFKRVQAIFDDWAEGIRAEAA